MNNQYPYANFSYKVGEFHRYFFRPSFPSIPWADQDLWMADDYNGGEFRVATNIPPHLIEALLKEGASIE